MIQTVVGNSNNNSADISTEMTTQVSKAWSLIFKILLMCYSNIMSVLVWNLILRL